MDCIFCKIVNGEIPSNKIYEDDDIVAFNDLSPQSPIHFLSFHSPHTEFLFCKMKHTGVCNNRYKV